MSFANESVVNPCLTISGCRYRCAEPEADVRKKEGGMFMASLAFSLLLTGYYKRFKWSPLKTRAITYLK